MVYTNPSHLTSICYKMEMRIFSCLLLFIFISSCVITSSLAQECGDRINVNLGPEDLNQLKADTELCVDGTDCYLTWINGVVQDNVGLPVS